MSLEQPNNPLHGITLEQMLTRLVERYGWDTLGRWIDVRCFQVDPSMKSSLKFLRRTPWARQKVEDLFVDLRQHDLKRSAPSGEAPDADLDPDPDA